MKLSPFTDYGMHCLNVLLIDQGRDGNLVASGEPSLAKGPYYNTLGLLTVTIPQSAKGRRSA